MVRVITNTKLIFSLQEIWFANKFHNDLLVRGKNIFYQASTPFSNEYQEFYTSEIELAESIDNIYKKIKKNVRYEINRADKREGIQCSFYESTSINGPMIKEFINSFDNFASVKNLYSFPLKRLKKIISNELLILTIARLDDIPLIYHTYIIDSGLKKVRLLTSHHIEHSDIERKIYGYANKKLHWDDIIWFKKKGFMHLDFGGINIKEKDNGITQFKLSFGGEIKKYYNFEIIKWW